MRERLTGTPGTISHGTLRDEDLIKAFGEELKRLDPERFNEIEEENSPDLRAYLDGKTPLRELSPETMEEISDYIHYGLMDSLNDCAPAGHYFGTHEGDGSDFGFWPARTTPPPTLFGCWWDFGNPKK